MKNISAKVVEKLETHILCSIPPPPPKKESCRLWGSMENVVQRGHATDNNMAHAQCLLDT